MKKHVLEKTLEESIVSAMDGDNILLVKYLPYILQDLWEIGTSPVEIVKIIKKYKNNYSDLKVLDLGSGKGAVSVNLALELKCNCFGIDGIKEFVTFSNNKAKECNVENICTFEAGDIRTKINTLGKYDIIILGAIGSVFGNYYETLTQLSPHINNDGLIIIDDAFAEDNCPQIYPNVLKKSELLNQVKKAGMEITQIITINDIPETNEDYNDQFQNIEKRCMELAGKYPKDKELFLGYIEKQRREYEILSNEIIPAMFVINRSLC